MPLARRGKPPLNPDANAAPGLHADVVFHPLRLRAVGDNRPHRVSSRIMDPLLARITIDPAVCHGKPCVRGLRYPVEMLLELLSSGMTTDDILADYEDLDRDDLLAALAYAARLTRTKAHPAGGTVNFLVDAQLPGG